MLDMVINHTYTITLFQTMFGQDVINRYSYVLETLGSSQLSGTTLLTNWWTDFGPKLRAIQHDQLDYVKAQVFHLGGTEGTFENTLTGNGDVVSATYPPTPSWLCMSFRMFTTEGVSRSGWKRIAGLVEANVVDNVLDLTLGPDLTADVNAFRDKLETTFDGGIGNIFGNAVTRLIEGSSPPAYAGFKVLDAALPFLGSQVSRKPGHGS